MHQSAIRTTRATASSSPMTSSTVETEAKARARSSNEGIRESSWQIFAEQVGVEFFGNDQRRRIRPRGGACPGIFRVQRAGRGSFGGGDDRERTTGFQPGAHQSGHVEVGGRVPV